MSQSVVQTKASLQSLNSEKPLIEHNDEFSTSPSNPRKTLLLIIFCITNFLDVLNIGEMFTAIPVIASHLKISDSDSVWIISAYQLTFAAFLLISGRLADLYNPKFLFTGGLASLGFLSLGTGFVSTKVALFVLRALSGIAAALTIPSALHLIVHMYPKKDEQAQALAIFGIGGALGNVIGIILGAVLVQKANFHWVFWIITIAAVPLAAICVILIPSQVKKFSSESSIDKIKRLDLLGIAIATAALVLFIFALVQSASFGWDSATVIAPLIVSIVLAVAFFIYEAYLPEEQAALPPKIWFYPNVSIVASVSLFPYMWWGAVYLLLSPLWQDFYGWSPILTSVRFLPIGIFAMISVGLSATLQKQFQLKTLFLGSALFLIAANLLLPFANARDRYWSIAFPAFILGTAGAAAFFANASIAIFMHTPAAMAGTIAAIFNSALQLGSAVGNAAIKAIETSVNNRHGGGGSFKGREASFWFLLGLVVLEAIAIAVFYHDRALPKEMERRTQVANESNSNLSEVSV